MKRVLLASTILGMSFTHVAVAQTASAPETTRASDLSGHIAEIIVTGRKRDERLIDAPLSISAYSDEKLEELDLDNLTQIANITPGFKFAQQALSSGFRMLSQIRFRGMTAFTPRPNNQVGAIFVDGAYVAAGSSNLNTDDVERIEVIKGPQNAYFGRNTFGGAVNFITRTPKDEFSGRVSAEYRSYDSYKLSASVDDSIIDGVLSGRILASVYQNGSQYDSGDGGEVGKQKTKSIAASLYFTPNDKFSLRLRGSYQHDEDWGNLIMNYVGQNANCRIGTVNFYCGALPTMGDSYERYSDGQRVTVSPSWIYQDTSLVAPALVAAGRPNALMDMLSNTAGQLNDIAFIGKLPSIDHFGSESNTMRFTAVGDYDLGGGYKLSGSFGYGDFRAISLRDNDQLLGYTDQRPNCNQATPEAREACNLNATNFLLVPFWARDMSAELRVSSPTDNRLRAMVGVSYFKQWLEGNIGGSGKSLVAGTGLVSAFSNNDRDRSYAYGLFGALSYDILDNLTLDLEGRFQHEAARQFTQTGSFAANTIAYNPVFQNYNEFLPRVILTWKPQPETTLYGSYSIGVMAGVANVSFNNIVNRIAALPGNRLGTNDPAEIRRLLGEMLNYDGVVPESVAREKIDHYEVGWKQSFMDGRAALTLAGYHIKWANMKASAALQVPDLDGDGVADNIGPTLPAKSRIWGAEFSFDIQPIEGLSLSLNGEILDHKFTDYLLYGAAAQVAGTTIPLSGVGKTGTNYATSNLFGAARYTHDINDDMSGYIGTEITFTGKQWLTEYNTAYLKPFEIVNARAGINRNGLNVEVFVTNLFNYDGPMAGRRNTMGNQTTGVTVYPAQKRSFGIRTSLNF